MRRGKSNKFALTDTKRYVPVVTLSTQDNTKLLQQLKTGFKRTINWNKYQSKVSRQTQNDYLDQLIDPSFQGLYRVFVLSFENEVGRERHTGYYLIQAYNVKIDGRNSFDQPINLDIKTYENIRQIATGQGNDYTIACLLDYHYFKESYKMIALDLSKLQVLNVDPGAIQQINFTGNLDRGAVVFMFFIFEEGKETVLCFSQGTVKVS